MEVEGSISILPSLVRTFEEQLKIEKTKRPEATDDLEQINTLAETKLFHELTDLLVQYLVNEVTTEGKPLSFSAEEKVECLLFLVAPLRTHLDGVRWYTLVNHIINAAPADGVLCVLPLFKLSKVEEKSGAWKPMAPNTSVYLTTCLDAHSKRILEQEIMYTSAMAYTLARAQKLSPAQESLEEATKYVESAISLPPIVRATYHKACAQLAKARGKHSEFYKQSLIYISYTPTGSLEESERVVLARDVSVAALVASDIFNFGELLQQAVVLSALRDMPENRWLFETLESFHKGSIEEFEAICKSHEVQMQNTDLWTHMAALKTKISSLAFLRLAFTRSAAGAVILNANGTSSSSTTSNSETFRTISFVQIASACRVTVDEVEVLVMRALAQKLVRGRIDQVQQCVHIQWVKPVLLIDNHSLGVIQDRLCRWASATQDLRQVLQVQTSELLGL